MSNTTPTILIADDESGFLEVMEAKLQAADFQTITATNGNEAIEKVAEKRPSVILMDIEMPEKDGVSAAIEIASRPATANIPIIFVTNLNSELIEPMLRKSTISLNKINYFRKDGDYNALIKNIQKLVEQ